MKKTVLSLSVITFIFFMCAFPTELIKAASESLCLWYSKVLPCLFPFSICINILTDIGFPQMLGKKPGRITETLFHVNGCGAFPFVMGALAGYPSGAKAIFELYEKKLLSVAECQCLLSFCNNPGPIFVTATVGAIFLSSKNLGYILLISSLLASITVGFIYGGVFKPQKTPRKTVMAFGKNAAPPFGKIIVSSVTSASNTLIIIGGCMMLFAIIIKILYILNILSQSKTLFNALVAGFLEMTNGTNLVGELSLPIYVKMAACAFVLNLGGASIQMQIMGIVSEIPFNRAAYFLTQLLKALVASVIAVILWFICYG